MAAILRRTPARRSALAAGAGLIAATALILVYAAMQAVHYLDDRGALVLAVGAIWLGQGLRAWIRAVRS